MTEIEIPRECPGPVTCELINAYRQGEIGTETKQYLGESKNRQPDPILEERHILEKIEACKRINRDRCLLTRGYIEGMTDIALGLEG